MNSRVLLVEDSAAFRKLMYERLRLRGYEIYEAWSLASARRMLPSVQPSVVLLDLELDGEDGYELLKESRDGRAVIVVSAREKAEERVRCLTLGAADYIVKPIDFDELVLRIERAERLQAPRESSILLMAAGDVRFDLVSRRISGRDKESDPLSPAEARLLRLLAEAKGRAIPREEIARDVLGRQTLVEGRSIDVMVSKMRRKLDAVGAGRLIQSVRGLGYRLSERPAP